MNFPRLQSQPSSQRRRSRSASRRGRPETISGQGGCVSASGKDSYEYRPSTEEGRHDSRSFSKRRSRSRSTSRRGQHVSRSTGSLRERHGSRSRGRHDNQSSSGRGWYDSRSEVFTLLVSAIIHICPLLPLKVLLAPSRYSLIYGIPHASFLALFFSFL
jgi:hypothetical protein